MSDTTDCEGTPEAGISMIIASVDDTVVFDYSETPWPPMGTPTGKNLYFKVKAKIPVPAPTADVTVMATDVKVYKKLGTTVFDGIAMNKVVNPDPDPFNPDPWWATPNQLSHYVPNGQTLQIQVKYIEKTSENFKGPWINVP